MLHCRGEKWLASSQLDIKINFVIFPISFFRPPSMERDTTIMRPSMNDDCCLQVPNSSDYLIPVDESRIIAERLLSEATGVTIPDTMPTYSLTNSMKMPSTNCWETSFSKPNPKPKLVSNDSMEVSVC